MSKKDKRFLIRSSGHILGPFFKDEVIELIKKGKISVFDEVAEPYTIWFYLQDHAEFKKIVISMSIKTRLVNFLSSVSTNISQISKKSNDMTVDKTLTEASKQTLSPIEKESASIAEVEIIKPAKDPHKKTAVKSEYQSEKEVEEVVKERISTFISWTWKIIIIA
ncbi:MAG: hypothetical protein OXC37_05650, partial [Bdellovibrionaceae bacterium]|nr:hypothetical protein [Pseudobdellovibrionaceae bacterium]